MSDSEIVRAYLAERDAHCPGCGYNLRGVREPVCPECAGELSLVTNPIRCGGLHQNDRDTSLQAVLIGMSFALCGAAAFALFMLAIGRPFLALLGVAVVAGLLLLMIRARRKTGWLLRLPAVWRTTLGVMAWGWLIGPVVLMALYTFTTTLFGWP